MAPASLRIPRLKTFMGFMSLQTGTELIVLALLFNKVTGLYGLLAILTGFALSAFQVLTYLYSLAAFGAFAYLLSHVRRQSALQCLCLAWLYVVDTVVNAGATAAFATNWFMGSDPKTAKPTATDGTGVPAPTQTQDDGPRISAADTVASLVLIVLFTLVRAYLSLVVTAYARQVLQRRAEVQEARGGGADEKASSNPFATGQPEGEGWRGRLGRVLVSVGKSYWLEPREDERDSAWTRDMHSKFRNASPASGIPAS